MKSTTTKAQASADADGSFVAYFRHWRTGQIVFPKNAKVIFIPHRRKRR